MIITKDNKHLWKPLKFVADAIVKGKETHRGYDFDCIVVTGDMAVAMNGKRFNQAKHPLISSMLSGFYRVLKNNQSLIELGPLGRPGIFPDWQKLQPNPEMIYNKYFMSASDDVESIVTHLGYEGIRVTANQLKIFGVYDEYLKVQYHSNFYAVRISTVEKDGIQSISIIMPYPGYRPPKILENSGEVYIDKSKPHVIIEVRGGCISAVISNHSNIKCDVLDYDNWKSGDMDEQEEKDFKALEILSKSMCAGGYEVWYGETPK